MPELKREITQRKAKVLIRDYLRETGKKGVTSLMRDIHRYAKKPIFAQRTLEKWLGKQDRMMQDETWEIVLGFIESDAFKRRVPYANEGPTEKRLKKVADGFVALYGARKNPDGIYLLPSQTIKQGQEAVQLLEGYWKNRIKPSGGNVGQALCRIEPVPGEPYAKFAYFSIFDKRQISTTGIVLYLNSVDDDKSDYFHRFILQVWRRRDPETGSTMPSQLIYFTGKKHQPVFSVSSAINEYNFEHNAAIAIKRVYHQAQNPMDINAPGLVNWRKQKVPVGEETVIVDTLLEEVLPHGYAEA